MSQNLQPQNIWAIGRNYSQHAKELQNEVPTEPVVFLKAGSCLQADPKLLHFPEWAQEIHHEVELGLVFDHQLNISHAVVAIDFTERRLQNELKSKGLPWTLAKSFHGACAVAPPFPIDHLGAVTALSLRLWVNGELRQNGHTSDMIFSPEYLLNFTKKHLPVRPGDLLLTGTPSGVGPIVANDEIRIQIGERPAHQWKVIFDPPKVLVTPQ